MALTTAPPAASKYAPPAHTNDYQFSQGTGYVLPEYAAVVPEAVAGGATEHHRILIVGGGITGLTLACALAQLGVDCVLLDEDNTVGVKGASSRGICYTQRSLEIFDKLGIFEHIKAKGIQWSVGRTFAGHDEVYSFDLKQQTNFSLSQQPAFINIQQFYNESFLVDRIAALGHAHIRWNNRVTKFHNDNGLATFTIATTKGEYRATADYVVDATGSKSPFRQWLGVGVAAKKGDDRWCIADVRFNTRPPTERHTWIEAPFNDNRAVWQHLMADDVWRIDYQMAPDADPEYVSSESQVRERLAKQFGADTQVDIVWVGPYAYRSECVDSMCIELAPQALPPHGQRLPLPAQQPAGHTRKLPPGARAGMQAASQVFLIGDSAKVVSPFGARGGNTGIADADNLAWKLAAVVQGHAAPALLASYHPERHEAATTNVQVTNRTARFLRPADGVERLFRTAAIGLAKHHAFARALVNTGRMAVANPYSASPLTDAALGTSISIQNVAFEWAGHEANAHANPTAAAPTASTDPAGDHAMGHMALHKPAPPCLNDLLRWAGTRALLLVFADDSAPMHHSTIDQLCALATAYPVRIVHVVAKRGQAQVRETVVDAPGQLARACGLRAAGLEKRHAHNSRRSARLIQNNLLQSTPCHWALLRPDSYLAARGNQLGNELAAALARCAGLQCHGAKP
jgi:3-(3-hydroxy-phenyl)propionate hydroxylase